MVTLGTFGAFQQVNNISGGATCVLLCWVRLVVMGGGYSTLFGDDCTAFASQATLGTFGAFQQVNNISGGATCVLLCWVRLVVMGGSYSTSFGDGCTAFASQASAWHSWFVWCFGLL